ncbi:MAG: cache domain-containing protein [Planctomycetota bacterium]
MKRFFPLVATLRGRLVLLVCLSTLPALLLTFWVADNERRSTMKRMEDDARHLAGLASREHAHQIGGARRMAALLAGMLETATGRTLMFDTPEFLPGLLVGSPQFANIFILDADGRVVRSAHPLDHDQLMTDNPAFVRAINSTEVETGAYVIGPIVNRPVLHQAKAARAPDGTLFGVVFIAIDLRWLDELASQVELPIDYSLIIADRVGRVLARSGTVDGATGGGEVIPGLLAMSDQRAARIIRLGSDQQQRLFVSAPMQGVPGVSVVAGLPYERLQGESSQVFFRTLGGLALLTLVTLLSVLVAAEVSIVRTVRSLSNAARRFGAGDLSARATVVHASGELHELADAFNSMADTLTARHRELTAAKSGLRALTAHLQMARETEGARIARELHDEIGQVLTSLKIDISSLCRRCIRDGGGDQLNATLAPATTDMCARIDGAVDFVRRVSSELRPTVLDRLGLTAALEWQAREIQERAGIGVEADLAEVEEPVDWLVSITLFRIAQEAMTNVVRHAAAKTIRLQLAAEDDGFLLTIRDDGVGIDPAVVDASRSIGILGMRERAALVGGTLDIQPQPSGGTMVLARVPRTPHQEDADALSARG